MFFILQKSLTPELLTSLLDFIRNNDIAIGEDCDKVITKSAIIMLSSSLVCPAFYIDMSFIEKQ